MNSQKDISTTQAIDFTHCDNEPIHTPGSIQPHGILFVLEEPHLKILQISQNTFQYFGLQPAEILNQNLNLLLDSSQIKAIQNRLKNEPLPTVNIFKLTFNNIQGQDTCFTAIIHRSNLGLILELEPVVSSDEFAFLDFYYLVRPAVVNVQKTTTLQEMCQIIAREVRKNTGYDRVMIYKFDAEQHGSVIAENKREDLESFLGLRYPSTDIPQPARDLYLLNWLRLIVDVNYQPIDIMAANENDKNEPLDLSFSVLRSVSPCHIQYLKNMGVAASLCISLIRDKQLWGMIVCHHYSPRYVSYEARAACEFLGQVMSLEIPFKEDHEERDYRIKIRAIQTKILKEFSAEYLIDGLVKHEKSILDLVNAQGAVVCAGNSYYIIGNNPPKKYLNPLIDWLKKHLTKEIFFTESLSQIYPDADKIKEVASGLLAISISKSQNIYVFWFRPEVIQTVNWAGNPDQAVGIEEDQGVLQLCPRKSFEIWKEKVKFRSLPWKTCEIEAALELREAIINIVLRQAAELAKLNLALQESEAREREKANQLKKVLKDLQRTQTQLIQNEKMASLGQLVAGVAHEINNPINFIYGNLAHTDGYTQDLLDLLDIYNKKFPNPGLEIQKKSEKIDLDFLVDDLPKMLLSMKMGAERIREIVNSLRNFARLDEAEMKRVDLHEGIDSTLLILNNRLKATASHPLIQVIKDYGDIPFVECYAGQLNQVFMNILANAIDAIEESYINGQKSFDEPGEIRICTELINHKEVAIQIKDNGIGISEKVQPRLFDPFFTTKPVGKGTGIGLAISYQIVVEKHSGQLKCVSTLGQGAEFIIEIPLTLSPLKS